MLTKFRVKCIFFVYFALLSKSGKWLVLANCNGTLFGSKSC